MLSISIDKQQLFFNKFYKRGFLTATGPSGSMTYYECIYLMLVNSKTEEIKLIDNFASKFFVMCMYYMGIRTDHSLFEMIITLPWDLIIDGYASQILSTHIDKELYGFDMNEIKNDTYIDEYFIQKNISSEQKEKLLLSLRNLDKEWDEFNQTKAWHLLEQLFIKTGEEKVKFFEIIELLKSRIEYIKTIC